MNGNNSENKGEPLSEKAYLEARKQYDDAELEVSGRYDTWILTLAGGALGLSITFLEKIAPHPQIDTLCWLKWSWVALIVSLLAALTSLVTSQSAIRENRKELDSAIRILKVTAFGDWVRCGQDKNFFSQTDLAFNAKYLEAFERLCQKGLVRHQSTILYRLTGTGFDVARRLKNQSNPQ